MRRGGTWKLARTRERDQDDSRDPVWARRVAGGVRVADDAERGARLREYRLWHEPGWPRREAMVLSRRGARGLPDAQRLSDLAFLVRAVRLLSGPDAVAVLAASTAPNGCWLGEHKHAAPQSGEACANDQCDR